MQNLSRRFMLIAGLGLLAGTALAQPMGPGGRSGMMGRGMMHPTFADHAAYLAGVKSELGITDAQEGAWKTYAEAVNGAATQMQAMHQTMWDAMSTGTWEERRDMMNRAFQAHQQTSQAVHDAALALLPSLSERQKGKAEIVLPGLARHGMGRGMGHGMGGGIGPRGMMGPR